jgi:hypothetical protein
MDDNEVIPVDFPVIIPRSTYVECLPSGLQYLESLAASAQSLIGAMVPGMLHWTRSQFNRLDRWLLKIRLK